jgi:hypothetical protein
VLAPIALNAAQVFCHVVSERFRVTHNLVADIAGRVAKMYLIVIVAASSRGVRLVAHAANVAPINFVNLLPGGRPSLKGLGQGIACKFQVAR